jgi:hypothetical protein
MAYLADALERVVSGRTKQNELHDAMELDSQHICQARLLSRRISSGADRQLKTSLVIAV